MQRPRSARHAVTSRAIEENAVRLVLKHGLDAVTVDMICEAAGISQRTFFNHFSTKLQAIVGAERPRVDEAAIHRFLASDRSDVLGDLLELLAHFVPGDSTNPELSAARWTLLTRTPALLQIELDRMIAVHRELIEVLALRLARHAAPDETPQEIRDQANLLSHLVAGIMRYSIEPAEPRAAPQPLDLQRTRAVLAQLLPKLSG
ncbi:MAG: TetR/AcrR family transcriptional regulator [Salinibacterium sp.]|nr:TetR/AcrR family transcriptional regulator [Salinibacterium sp.]